MTLECDEECVMATRARRPPYSYLGEAWQARLINMRPSEVGEFRGLVRALLVDMDPADRQAVRHRMAVLGLDP